MPYIIFIIHISEINNNIFNKIIQKTVDTYFLLCYYNIKFDKPKKGGEVMTEKMLFDYSKLRGRIVEKVGSLTKFAELVGISNTSLNDRLQNRLAFNQREIFKAAEILGIPDDELSLYFFTI